ncbi:hypothetical protein [Psychromarinibacter sp. S121]|uniref:hypothetical protein n=1 Tax=Psychromarinibacter sp. S121 TaxID=3415127 RepID=UPI003C7D5526
MTSKQSPAPDKGPDIRSEQPTHTQAQPNPDKRVFRPADQAEETVRYNDWASI